MVKKILLNSALALSFTCLVAANAYAKKDDDEKGKHQSEHSHHEMMEKGDHEKMRKEMHEHEEMREHHSEHREHKVTVCHKGKKTIEIDSESLEDHMGHGDTHGSCE